MEDKVLDLTLAVYRLTKLFPDGEVLILQMRREANQILACVINKNYKEAICKAKTILYFLKVARRQDWTREINFVILDNKYEELLKELSLVSQKSVLKKRKVSKKKSKFSKLTARQKKICEFIRNKKMVRTKVLFDAFDKITDRTIRRDLQELVKKNFVFQEGRGRGSVYRIYSITEEAE